MHVAGTLSSQQTNRHPACISVWVEKYELMTTLKHAWKILLRFTSFSSTWCTYRAFLTRMVYGTLYSQDIPFWSGTLNILFSSFSGNTHGMVITKRSLSWTVSICLLHPFFTSSSQWVFDMWRTLFVRFCQNTVFHQASGCDSHYNQMHRLLHYGISLHRTKLCFQQKYFGDSTLNKIKCVIESKTGQIKHQKWSSINQYHKLQNVNAD